MDIEQDYMDYREHTQNCGLPYHLKVINELIESEKTYVQDLREICEVYIPCIRHLETLGERELYIIFHNIKDIYVFSKELLTQLENRSNHVEEVLNIFCQNSQFKTVYTPYCTNYPRSNSMLEQALRQHNILAVILKDLQSSLGHALPLASYLHKPVQRIMKYHLLLKNLHDYLDSNSSHLRERAYQAYSNMSDCARVIDESKRINEMDVETRNLHRFLIDSDTKEFLGTLLREAEMKVFETTRPERVTANVYMFDKVIIICYREQSSTLSIKNIIKCDSIVLLEELDGQPKVFSLVPVDHPSRAIFIEATSLTQKLDWCIQLEKLTKKNIPDKAKKLLVTPPIDPLSMKGTVSQGRRSRSSVRNLFTQNSSSNTRSQSVSRIGLKKGIWSSLTSMNRFSRSSSSRRISMDEESQSSTGSFISSDGTTSSIYSPVSEGISRSPSALSRESTDRDSVTSTSSEISNFFSRFVKRISRSSLHVHSDVIHKPSSVSTSGSLSSDGSSLNSTG